MKIHPLDLKFQGAPQVIAAYLVLGPDGPVLVETGPGSTLSTLHAELARFGLTPADVRDVLVSHIHLDHAGAAGWWTRQGARIHVHYLGAPHLIEPSKLLLSASRIYGDQMKPLWGEFLASPAEQVHVLHDGDVVEAGGLRFTALDTPGHARHHMAYQLEQVIFTGDLAGVHLPGQHHIHLPTPPPEFDLLAWLASIERLRGLKPKQLYLTHFGAVDEPETHWAKVVPLLHSVSDLIGNLLRQGVDRETIVGRFSEFEAARQQADGLSESDRWRYATVGPMGMSVDGILRYWQKR
jgi:glyoxylase-like metal-dependent hydrolase (beta-lactamase superfamily II)